jgi:hypothetical protein
MAMHADEGGVTAVGLLGSQGNEVEIVKVFLEDSQALPSEGLLAVAMQLGLYIPFEIEPVILLSLRRGPVKNRFGSWDRYVV